MVGVWLGLAAAAPVAAPAQAQPGLKVAFINSRTILQQTPGYAAAESSFNKEVQGFRDEVQKLQQQLDSAVKTFDRQQVALSPAAKQTKQRELQQLQQKFEQRSGELQDKAQQRERELLQPIQARVNGVIQGLRAEGNYQLIFDADAPGSNIVAADPSLDITSKVIERLKQSQ
ncbi:MAG TPA: OmpH family outer membrane protein [Gemmatimonadales bacterium]|nr:OmpH family outer membrane protein [Gemmatimonadales bacterium]